MIIYQYKNGYRYNSDSLILYDFIKDDRLNGIGLDIGAGSGILGILISKKYNLEMHAIDIQEMNAKLCEINYKANDLESKIFLDDFLAFKSDIQYDFLVSNPPFYSKMKAQNEHLSISRHADFMPIDKFLNKVDKLLKPHSNLYFCYDAKKIDLIFQALANTKLKCIKLRFVHTKKEKPANLALLKIRKVSKNDIEILPPLISYDGDKISNELASIYENIKVKSCDL